MKEKRGSFSNKLGFVLAAAGSAVGLGNLWRFPYLAAKYGGGIFLLVYAVLAVSLGFVLMVTEIALGRRTGLSVIGAFKKLNKKYGFIGYIAAAVPFIIVPYYCVIGGWVLKYFTQFLTGGGSAMAADTFFSGYISQVGGPLFWFILYMFITAVVVIFGVEKGIEKASRIMMPILVVLSIGIAAYVVTIPGAMEGVKYYLLPDFSKFSIMTVLAAMGQMFYSMSLAMGIMITYGSYMKKEDHIESSVRNIEIFDTGIAFLAGLMIVPAVYTFSGGDQAALGQGPGLMFVTLPKVFDSMMFGNVIGTVFFALVFVAALTSSISLMETVVSIICDKTKLTRKKATIIITAVFIVAGCIISLGYGPLDFITIIGMQLLDFFDFISNSILMPIAAFLTCVFVGYVVKVNTVIDEVELNGTFKEKKWYIFAVKYVAPICMVVILVVSILDAFNILNI